MSRAQSAWNQSSVTDVVNLYIKYKIVTTVVSREDSYNPGIECVVYQCDFRTTNRIGNCTRKLGSTSCFFGVSRLAAWVSIQLHSANAWALNQIQEMGCNFLQTGIKKCFSDTFPSNLLIVDFLPGSHYCYKAAMRTWSIINQPLQVEEMRICQWNTTDHLVDRKKKSFGCK